MDFLEFPVDDWHILCKYIDVTSIAISECVDDPGVLESAGSNIGQSSPGRDSQRADRRAHLIVHVERGARAIAAKDAASAHRRLTPLR
ncbi:MAG: hypothetical protein ABSF86_03710 [Steroidobacteraceae bacterium]|jgi:hypothetical protein